MAYKTGKLVPIDNLLEVFDEEVEYDEEKNLYKYADYSEENHCVCIKFDQMFERPDIKQHNIFRIQYRKYYKILNLIVDDLNYILNQENDAARKYVKFNMKIAIDEEKNRNYNEKDFFEDIIDFVNEIKTDVIEYVERDYSLDLNTSSKINIDLQVTDQMNKVYIETSITMRMIIPICCVYSQHNETDSKFLYKIFRTICKIFSEEKGVNALTKLTRLIKSRIYSTKYNNKKIWNFLKNKTNDMEIMTIEYFVYLIENILPKLEPNKPSVQYLDVVLRQKIEFAFTYKYPVDFKPLKNLDNDDDCDERDRLNEMMFTNRTDEGSLVLNNLTIKYYVDEIMEDFDMNDILEFKKENLKDKNLNEIQNYFLMLYYGKKFEVVLLKEEQRLILLYNLIYELMEDGYTEIPKILSSCLDSEKSNRTRSSVKIKNSKYYVRILNDIYGDVMDIVENDNFITKIIDFKNFSYIDEDNNEIEIETKFENEVLRFLQMIQ